MTTVEVLREARSLVDTPEKLVRGRWFDEDERGEVCGYCGLGAIAAVATHIPEPCSTHVLDSRAAAAIDTLRRALGKGTDDYLPYVIDAMDYAAVLAAFDKAIALAEAEEA